LKEDSHSSNKENKEGDGDNKEESENSPGESQKKIEEGTLLFVFC